MKFQKPSDLPAADATVIRDDRYRFIDGLRAVSILAVVGFHIGLPGFSGGFIGVDVFFVISGYLIITQIVTQLEAGTFSLSDFWARRALRILPPFAIVIVLDRAGLMGLGTPTEITDFSNSIAYASAMLANHFFYKQQGYFDTAANLKPLLHTWTLSVEEQFYVIVPLLLVGLMWLRRLTKVRGIVIGAAVALFVTSFVACVSYTSPGPNPAFFVMPFRAWEFVAGGLVTVLIPVVRRMTDKWCELAAVAGLLAIVAPIASYGVHLLYPSYYPAVPVVGAVVVIAVGLAQPHVIVTRLLATPIFVGIGLVSYSWYLWHWPLLSFARIYDFGPLQTNVNLLAAGVSFLLAVATYLRVEQPVRHHRPRSGARLWMAGSAAGVTLGLVGWAGYMLDHIAAQHSEAQWAAYGLPQPMKVWLTEGEACSLKNLPITNIPAQCANQPWIESFALLMGDSHAMTAFPTYQEEARQHGIQLLTRVDGSCLPLLHTRATHKGVPMTSCHDGMRQAVDMLKRLPGKLPFVILKAGWTGLFDFPISPERPTLDHR
jgi:peptidoglycan/LPS O-acetylase OafA/YrhL